MASRAALSTVEVRQRSETIQRRALTLPVLSAARRWGLYVSIRGEVETDLLFASGLSSGKSLFFPRLDQDRMLFIKVSNLKQFQPGRWGLREPTGADSILPSQLDCIVVPGVAFDRRGYRLGFGKGYYDRTLKGYRGVKVGLSYDFQVVDQLPVDMHDLRCDWVVSESHLLGRFL